MGNKELILERGASVAIHITAEEIKKATTVYELISLVGRKTDQSRLSIEYLLLDALHPEQIL